MSRPDASPLPASEHVIKVRSIHVGRPRLFDVESEGEAPWESGIVKSEVDSPIRVTKLNLEGDEQADLVHHGGVDKAVLAYSANHFEFWRQEFQDIAWTDGAFGENLTLEGVTESDVCVGDVFEVNGCWLQISQPRQPCWKLSRRWNQHRLAVRVQQTRRTGWYYRVLNEGMIQAGQTMTRIECPFPEWTIIAANAVMYGQPRDPDVDQRLANCPALSVSWRKTLLSRSAKHFG